MNESLHFVDALAGGTVMHDWLLLRGEKPQKLRSVEPPPIDGRDVFVVVNETDGRGTKNENVTDLRALFIDIDHTQETPEWHLAPNIIVKTGKGLHAYWLLYADQAIALFKPAQKALAALYGSDPKVCNPARVMRVPGYPYKGDENVPVALLKCEAEPRYRIEEVVDLPSKVLAEARVEYWLGRLQDGEAGERNDILNKAAFEIKDYGGLLPLPKIREKLLKAAWLCGLGEEEAEATVQSAFSAVGLSEAAQEILKDEAATLTSTNEVDLGLQLAARHTEVLVSGRRPWTWIADKGVWEGQSIDVLRQIVLRELHGATAVSPEGKLTELKLSWAKVKAVADVVLLQAERGAAYWDDAVPGIACANGFLDQEGGLWEYHPDLKCRAHTDVVWDPKAECPEWEAFLHRCHPDRPEIVNLLAEFAGVAVLGAATSFNRCLFLLGRGANGKSLFLEGLRMLLPESLVSTVGPHKWGHEYNLNLLRNSLLNLAGEVPYKLLEADVVKTVIAGEDVVGRAPYEPPSPFRPRAAHIFSANELPPSADASWGWWRRMLVVHWPVTFSEGADGWVSGRELLRRFESEKAGILRWVVLGGRRALARGDFLVPEAAEKAAKEWRVDSDPVASFLEDHRGPWGWVLGEDVYRLFGIWVGEEGRQGLSRRRFYHRLQDSGVPRRRAAAGVEFQLKEAKHVAEA